MNINIKYNKDGLIPVITIDNISGKVLMLAYMNEEAFSLTQKTGKVHYYSRSRNSLWLKGETSGHYQNVIAITADCDMDTLLIRVNQEGVACHTGAYSCFFNEIMGEDKKGFELLAIEQANIMDRKKNPVEKSYTNYLFDSGVDKICKKVAEEAAETIIAAKNSDKKELAGEVADLLFHVQVLLASQDMSMNDVLEVIETRQKKQGNLKEKNVKGEI